jgi:hypothetical protein
MGDGGNKASQWVTRNLWEASREMAASMQQQSDTKDNHRNDCPLYQIKSYLLQVS